jgi:hypothetical protein
MTTSQLENCIAAEQDYNNCQAYISLRVRHHLSSHKRTEMPRRSSAGRIPR